MRIDRQPNFPIDKLPKNMVEGKKVDSFSNVMMKSQANLTLEALNQLMARIDTQGTRLAKQRTLENLRDYKKLVKQFLREVLNNGLQLTDKQYSNGYGGMKTHQIVEIIDQKLIDLQEEVMMVEKEGIDILNIVGEIKGLLINLYM